MIQLIDATTDNPILLNPEHITAVEEEGGYRTITCLDGYKYHVIEDYYAIKQLLRKEKEKCQTKSK